MMPAAGNDDGDRYAEWDAAYVLGALSPSDRHAYERHLTECDPCRAAVSDLAGMPGLLSTVSTAHAETLGTETAGATTPADDARHTPAPVVPLTDLAHAARRSRHRRRTLSTAAAVALVIAGAISGSLLTGHGPFAPPDGTNAEPSSLTIANARTLELRPVGEADMRAHVVITPTDWGTRLQWSCHYPPQPKQYAPPEHGAAPPEPVNYALIVVGHNGARTVAATWTWSGGTTTGLDASSAVPLTDIDRIEISQDGQEEALAAATL